MSMAASWQVETNKVVSKSQLLSHKKALQIGGPFFVYVDGDARVDGGPKSALVPVMTGLPRTAKITFRN